MRGARVLGLTAAAVLLLASSLAGQSVLRGRVVESGTGTPIDGVVIRADGPARGSALSGISGEWRLGALPAGQYEVTVTRLGFAQRVVTVRLPDAAAAPLTLELVASVLPLDAVVVTASRRSQRLADVPVATELITRSDLEKTGASDLSTALVEQAGIQLQGGLVNGEGVMLEGLGSERVLILMDGQPLTGRINGQMDLSRIPTSMVERVEVVKGPQSSLYGSDAMGGVVNVITRSAAAEPWNVDLNVTVGEQGRTDGTATARGTVGSIGYMANGGRRWSELTPGRAGTNGALASRWDGIGKLTWSPSAAARLEGSLMLLAERQRWRSGQLYQFSDNTQSTAQLGGSWTRGAHHVAPAIYWTEYEHLARAATKEEPVEGSGDRETQSLLESEIIYNLGLGRSSLDMGVEAKREGTVSDRVIGRDRTLHTVEPFAQATLVTGSLSLVPGGRVTVSEEWGTHLSPRLSALLRPVPEVALRASVGSGFRAPSFKEMYITFLNIGPGYGYTVRGNPDLSPESAFNVSGSVEWARGTTYLRGQFFRNQFDDFIENRLMGDSAGVTIYTYGNVAHGFTRGGELEAGWDLGPLGLEAAYSYLEAKDEETDLALLDRPTHSGRLALDYALPFGVRAALTGVYTGSAVVERTETEEILREKFLRWDMRMAKSLPGGLELTLGGRNLAGTTPENWPGFTGRHLYLGLGWGLTSGASRP